MESMDSEGINARETENTPQIIMSSQLVSLINNLAIGRAGLIISDHMGFNAELHMVLEGVGLT